MSDEPEYFDVDGNPIPLYRLVKQDPGWAANRITEMSTDLSQLQDQLEDPDNWWREKAYETAREKLELLQQLEKAKEAEEVCLESREIIYKRTAERIEAKDKLLQLAVERNDELVDFAIWMTGCGYDFCQHEYFCEQRDKLLKDTPLSKIQPE